MASASPSVHRCTQCAKSYSRRENLVRHYRSAHDNITPYACSLCPSRFTRSDLLSRHRKTHEKDSTVVEDSAEISHVLNQDEPITPESRPNNKRLRPTLNGESAATRPQAENSSTMIDDAPRENVGNHDAIPDNRASSGYGPGHSLHQDYQTGISDWDLRWPFYGEGLHDANLDWTLDFLSQGISTHSPFDAVPVYGDPGHTPRPQDLEVFLDANISGVEIDGPHEHEPQAWPDQQSRAVNPRHHRKSHESSRSTGRVKAEERAEFLRKYSAQMAQTTSQISEEMREAMLETIHASLLDEFCHEKGARKSSFPALSTIDYFLQLYFVHIQPRFPVLHVPTFDPNKTPVILLLAMAIVGSTYSESNQSKFALSYLERTRMSIKLTQEKDSNYLRSVQHLLAFFLVSLSAMWLGHKMFYERAEGDRGELAIYCRRFELLDCRVKKKYSQSQSRQNRKRVEDSWMDWINEEQKKRLGLCIYLLDCQVAAFFQRQPYISKAETVNAALPCSDTFWNASTAWAWKALLGPADIPPSTYFLTTLTTILLYNETTVLPFPPLDDFCRTLYAYVLHSHVFEWRQTICMLNPTGLISSPLSLAPQNIGISLQERQRWLETCLGNWNTNYGDKNQDSDNGYKSSSGVLLYHLAMLALHINFSDLHIVAGRSGSDDDIGLAEQSLRNWLQNERAQTILHCTVQMLDAAWDAITAGEAQRSSFELAICLFMGGLTCWAMSRFGSPNLMLNLQQKDIALASRLRRDGLNELNSNNHEGSSGVPSLLSQVADARDGLRTLKCHRLAVAFGDILDSFIRSL